MEASSAVIGLVTAPPESAHSLARQLVESELVACVNLLGPVQSVYRWQGAIEEAEEALLVLKTTPAALDSLRDLLDSIHPYDTYELIVAPITDGAPAYLRWLIESVTPATD